MYCYEELIVLSKYHFVTVPRPITETHKCGHTNEQHILYYYAHANAEILNRKKRKKKEKTFDAVELKTAMLFSIDVLI